MSAPREESGAVALLAAARGGDASAREALLASYRGYVAVVARAAIGRRLRAKVDASDVAQEVLWKAHRGLDDFRGETEAELAAWLRRVLARTLADVVRRYAGTEARDVARERSLEEAVEASASGLRAVAAASRTTPSVAAERREAGVAVSRALLGLSPEHREVIVLRTLEERPWEEVAQCLNRSADAARMLWARALANLRPLLEPER